MVVRYCPMSEGVGWEALFKIILYKLSQNGLSIEEFTSKVNKVSFEAMMMLEIWMMIRMMMTAIEKLRG